MYIGFMSYSDANITVYGFHVQRNIECNIEHLALLKNLHDALQVYITDKKRILSDSPLKTQSNATNSEQLFHIDQHLCHLVER